MNPITPRGTRTREISMPLGRRHDSTTAPTGSGRVAISLNPWAISSMRDSVSVRRSRKALATRPRARSTSARLASSSTWLFSTRPRAICCSASFLVLVGQSAIARAAARAARARVSMKAFGSILIPSSIGAPPPAGPQPRDGLPRATRLKARLGRRGPSPATACRAHFLQNHQIVAVDHFIEALVPEPVLDLLRLRSPDLPELGRIEVHDSAGELLAARARQESHHLPRVEVALDLDYA